MKKMSNSEKKELINRKALDGGAKTKEFAGRNNDGTVRYAEGLMKFNMKLASMKGEEILVPPPYEILDNGKWILIHNNCEEVEWYQNHPR